LDDGAHEVHNDDPLTLLKVFGRHAVQDPPSCPVNPRLHWHADVTTAAAGESEFGKQLLHGNEPFETLYFPATQAVHAAPFAPVYPALQMQSVCLLLPAWELEAGSGHEEHVFSNTALGTVEYLPAAQFTQAAGSAPMPTL
jgi:hypothetical protein